MNPFLERTTLTNAMAIACSMRPLESERYRLMRMHAEHIERALNVLRDAILTIEGIGLGAPPMDLQDAQHIARKAGAEVNEMLGGGEHK